MTNTILNSASDNIAGPAGSAAAGCVALVSPTWPPDRHPNGIVTYVDQMRAALQRRGMRALIVTGHLDEPAVAPHPDIVQAPRLEVAQRATRGVWNRLRRRIAPERWEAEVAIAGLRSALQRLPDECTCIEMEESFGWAARVAGGRRALVLRLHGPWFQVGTANGVRCDRRFYQRVTAEGQAIRAADALIAPSYAVLRAVCEYYELQPRQATVIPLPIAEVPEPLHWRHDPDRPPNVLFVGRFDRVKGGDLALQAFARVAERVPKARLVFVGPDHGWIDASGRARSFAEAASTLVPARHRDKIDYRGALPRAEVDQLRRQAGVCLIASRYETFSYVGLEAMACGCPLVATRVGGLGEAVVHRSTGLLCDSENVDEMASHVVEVLQHPPLAEQLGRQAAQRVAESNHPDRIAALTLAVYRSAVAGHTPADGSRRAGALP